jgi:hypothetical protein
MSLFYNKSNNEPVIEDKTFDHIFPTTESLDMILTECAEESYKLRAGMYVADIVMEEQVMENSADPEVLMEGFTNDAWGKVKTMFTNLLAKLKDWYKKVANAISTIFTTGSEFATKYQSEIMDKNVKGFKYTGYKYTFQAGYAKVENVIDRSDTAVTEYLKGLDDDDAVDSGKQEENIKNNYKSDLNPADEKEKLLKNCGVASLSDLNEELGWAFRNGKKEPHEIVDFSANSKADMIKVIKDKSSALKRISDAQKALEGRIGRVIKAIESAASRQKEDKKSFSAYASHLIELIRYATSLAIMAARVQVDAIKQAATSFEVTLKKYLFYKHAKAEPTKESLEEIDKNKDDEKTESILESVMKYI